MGAGRPAKLARMPSLYFLLTSTASFTLSPLSTTVVSTVFSQLKTANTGVLDTASTTPLCQLRIREIVLFVTVHIPSHLILNG